MIVEDIVWSQKYRPRKVADTILPADLKATFQRFVDDNNVPNLLLTGRAGIGKTTVAKAMLDEIGADYVLINGSMKGNIDTLRTDIQSFASSVSFAGVRKYVILDEADYLNANSTQPALRGFMEEYSKNCGFILTCNFRNRIIEPLQSRCSVVEFNIKNKDKPAIAAEFFRRVRYILDSEGVKYEKKVVAEVIQKYVPDWRRVLNELQRYSSSGQIDEGILLNQTEKTLDALMGILKKKDFGALRKWVAENVDIESSVLYRQIYDHASKYFTDSSIPGLVVTLAEYQYKESFVADVEINTVACLTEIMVEASFK